MLTRLRLKDFKSFADQEVTLGPTTLLVGANGSGKSNFLDAIRFLQGQALGLSVLEILGGQSAASWAGIRGGLAEVVRFGHREFGIESVWSVAHESVSYDVRLQRLPNSAYRLGLGGELDAGVRRQAAAITSLDLVPHRMREHVSVSNTVVGLAGEHLSAALWHLTRDDDRKLDLVDWLSALCSPTIVDIVFDVTSLLEEVLVVLVEADGTRVSARTLSDGTLRFLGALVALLSAKDGDLILIEEIETGLHPSRVHLLIELVEEVTRGGRCQVIATTHSPLALLAASPATLRDAIVFGRVPEQPGTIMRRLGDLPRFDEVEARMGIDDMFTSSWLEQSL